MVNDSQSCIRPWLTMVNHGHLEPYGPWNDHHLTMVSVLLTDHGQYIGFDYHWPSYDHDYWPWSTMVIWRLIDHEMTIISSWSLHGWWWSWYYWLTMVNHGWPWSIYRIWLPLTIIWPWLLTMVDHGHDNRSILQTWSTMVRPWSIDGHFMVDHGQTMVDHGLTMILLQGIFSEKSQPRLAMICWWFYNDLFFWLVKQAFRSNREVYLSPVELRNSIISIFISAFALKAVH